MRLRDKSTLFNILLGTGLYLLDPVRDRFADRVESFTDRAKDAYDSASGRVRKASNAITGDDHSSLTSLSMLLLGVGVGVGLGILFAPASGEQIRSNLADKVQGFGDRVRSGVSRESDAGTGTYS